MNTRFGVAALATLATACALIATISPARSTEAVPPGDCAVPYPVADLTAGDPVSGLTVARGTTPQPFTGEVLGIVPTGIAPDLDMVIVQLTSPEIDRVGGIWNGMSGSPVYAEDGRLIGAVAYGLTSGPSPIAGVTTFEDMAAAQTLPRRLSLGAAAASALARAARVPLARVADGFVQLPVPSGVSGVRAARLRQYAGRDYRDRTLRTWTAGAGSTAGPETIVAGGNLGVTQAYGDVVMGGIGTVTTTCGDQVVGFGHPSGFLGRTSEVMHPAEALAVVADPVGGPFKLASLGAPAGTITGDHLTGVYGVVNQLPPTLDIGSTVTFQGRTRSGTTHVAVQRIAPDATYFTLVGNHDRVVDGLIAGSEDASWTITGHRSGGEQFTVSLGQLYRSRVDVTGASVWDAADEMYLLSDYPGVVLDSLTATAAVSTDATAWSLAGMQWRRAGSWVDLAPGDTVTARAGRTLVIRAVLTSGTARRTLRIGLDLPARLVGTSGKFRVQPGLEVFDLKSLWEAPTLDRFLAMAREAVRADQAAVWVEAFHDGRRVYGTTTISGAIGRVITSGADHSYVLEIR